MCLEVSAQPRLFGSSDDPAEVPRQAWWQTSSTLDFRGGVSLIGSTWRLAGGATFDYTTRDVAARFQGTVRVGTEGFYNPDVDEPYDLLRLVRYTRYLNPNRSNFYLRAGLAQRIRLGTGHVVNFFNSRVAWDERTVGAEFSAYGPALSLTAFTDNLFFNGAMGGRIGVSPFFWTQSRVLRSLELGVNLVTDFATQRLKEEALTNYNVDLFIDAIQSGAFTLAPFVSYSRYTNYGEGLFFGADLKSDNFIDLARILFRLGLSYNSRDFIPGFVGSFYTVNNPTSRIVSSAAKPDADASPPLEGVALRGAEGGYELHTELRLMIFRKFEFWYAFKRHFGSQPLSDYHFRLFLYSQRFTFSFGQDRGGLENFFSLFSALNDQTSLVFYFGYKILGPTWIHIEARYTYERIFDAEDGTKLFIVQRRFEPLFGFRIAL